MSKHLKQVQETRAQHARHALWIARQTAIITVVLVIHALFPDTFTATASRRLRAIEDFRMARERSKNRTHIQGYN